MPLFHGLSAFPITPADDRGRIDPEALAALLVRLRDAQVDSVGLLGSTGIYAYLTRLERRRAIGVAVETLRGQMPIIASIGALRTDDAQDLARDAQSAGADGLLLAPISYTPLTDEEVFQHVSAVASATDLPLCIYNNPSTTHFTSTADLLARLAVHPHIVAVKNPAPAPAEAKASIDSLRCMLPTGFALGYSADWHAPDAVLDGGDAWYSVIGGLLPRPSLALIRAAQAGDATELHRIQATFAPLWSLFKQHGSLRVVYAAANLLRLTAAQPPRPILPLSGPVRDCIAQVLEELGI